MRIRRRAAGFAIGASLYLVAAQHATAHQAASASEPALRDVLLAGWTDTGQKLITLAEEFPENKYDFRPVPEVRTFADQLRHVAFWNIFVQKTARGEPIDGIRGIGIACAGSGDHDSSHIRPGREPDIADARGIQLPFGGAAVFRERTQPLSSTASS